MFEREPIDWEASPETQAYCELLRLLTEIKRLPAVRSGIYKLEAVGPDCSTAVVSYEAGAQRLYGVFSLSLAHSQARLPLADGVYRNLAGGEVCVTDGVLSCGAEPVIISVSD